MNYRIIGEPMPVVECTLNGGEAMKTEKGSMAWMSPNMRMETSAGGGIGKAFGRMLSGDSIFQNIYTAEGGQGMICFGSSFTGSIRAIQITPQKAVICQKSSFLASELGVDLSIYFKKKLGSGLFGGEGFIMQRMSGSGMLFIEIDGTAVEYDLAPGQAMIVDTGHLVMMEETCGMDVVQVPGIKNIMFGGEGVFNTRVVGPGKIILQTMTVSGLAASLIPYLPSGNK
ncbi:MAG: TIGR00266 family protein [Clostridiales Family XIII bacterium]|jgi:uncharacterized protein (TIGR00266 family)|nr:TIGR00266 family protein [Clostridiales Family XIII bacterium]